MNQGPNQIPSPDSELEHLVSRFLDQTLTPEEAKRFEQRMSTDPDAVAYCAQELRFDARLQEAISPQSLHMEEVRRTVFKSEGGKSGWLVERRQQLRYGMDDILDAPPRSFKIRWYLALFVIVIAFVSVGLITYERWGRFNLRNGDFEAMDLSRGQQGVSLSLLHWQDNFYTTEAELCEIARVSKGRIYAKSGHNVARLTGRAFLNQLLLNRRSQPLKAAPGLVVVVRGWYFCEAPATPALRMSLRHVVSGYPEMIQYEAANRTIDLGGGGWHSFEIKLDVGKDLVRQPSDLNAEATQPPPSIDLRGRDLSLSLDGRVSSGFLLLDDLEIEVLHDGR